MSSQDDRRAIHAQVSGKAHDHWHDFAAEQGVSVSAIIEALARELGRLERAGAGGIELAMQDIVTNARRIDAKRRRRTKR